jgi:hypothetical protein
LLHCVTSAGYLKNGLERRFDHYYIRQPSLK